MIKINRIGSLIGVLFALALFWQPSLSAHSISESSTANSHNQNKQLALPVIDASVERTSLKLIQIEIVKLTDNSGLTYIGGKVNSVDLKIYLSQMAQILGDEFTLYRQNQATRDHQAFHMTLINPYEYQALTSDVAIGSTLSVSLLGLGRVSSKDKTTFFVVSHSPQAQKYRQSLTLKNKDFHVTLGFNPSDIYGVNKGKGSLIE